MPTADPRVSSSEAVSDHVIVYPFRVATSQGGLKSVLEREAAVREGGVSCFSPDSGDFQFGSLQVHGAEPTSEGDTLLDKRWVGTGAWELLYANAFTAATCHQEVLREMYAAAEAQAEGLGTLDYLISYINQHTPALAIEDRFAARFDGLFKRVPDGAVVNYQDFFVAEMVARNAGDLRSRGVFQTFHHHESVHPDLIRSPWGQRFLSLIAQTDRVYVHTENGRQALEGQFDQLALARRPEVRRFDLGIDSRFIEAGLQLQPLLRSGAPELRLEALDDRQSTLVRDLLASRETVPHRFICLDRIDPTKGLHTVLEAVDGLLSQKMSAGATLADLQKSMRFYFLHELFDQTEFDPSNMLDQYVRYIKTQYERLEEKYPSVIVVARSLKGEHRKLLPALMAGCHGVTGAADDGMGLAIMEIAVANRAEDTAVIAGRGGGFAIEAIRRGFAGAGFFPKAGDSKAFQQALSGAISLQRSCPGRLGEAKEKLVDGFIAKRNDVVLVSK